MTRTLAIGWVALVVCAAGCPATPVGGPDGGIDATPDADARPEAGLLDGGSDADAEVPDARVYPDCEVPLLQAEEITPGELYRLPPTGHEDVASISWDGRLVAYSTARCPLESSWGYDLFVFDLDTMLEGLAVARVGAQRNVWLSGSHVVFDDSYFSYFPSPENDERIELYHYDPGMGMETRLTDGNWAKILPVYNGTHVAYLSTEWDPAANTYDLIMRNVASGQEVILADHNQDVQRCYDISADWVTWQALSPTTLGTWDIFYHHIPSGVTDRLGLDTLAVFCSSVSATHLAWNEARFGNYDVFVVDLETLVETQVTTDPADQILWRIGDQFAAWFDYRHSGVSFPADSRDLYVYDFDDQSARRLTAASGRWGVGRPLSCQWLQYSEKYTNSRGRFFAWDLVAAGVLDQDCNLIPCDPATETCSTIQWRGLP